MTDLVNHPPHYTAHPSGVECIQITEHMGFNLGNAVKYIWRADLKDAAIQDLEKAIFYIKREIGRRENETRNQEERPRKTGLSEHIESDWAIGTYGEFFDQAYNQEGSMSTSEYLLQHHETWEDYIRAQETPGVCCG